MYGRGKKNTILYIALFFVLAILSLIFITYSSRKEDTGNFYLGEKKVKVEIVTRPKDLERGLGGRESLCENCGMLFVLPSPKQSSFWMKDMRFDLDMIWINDEKVVSISKSISHSSLDKISPGKLSDMVLEVNAGFSQKNDIKIGDKAFLE